MVLTGVVHNEVQADAHAAVMALVAEFCQVFHCAQSRLNLAEIRHCVAAVAAAGRAGQKGHKVDIVESALLQVVQMLFDALQGTGEAVGIHEHAEHLVAFVPLRNFLAHLIPLLQDR